MVRCMDASLRLSAFGKGGGCPSDACITFCVHKYRSDGRWSDAIELPVGGLSRFSASSYAVLSSEVFASHGPMRSSLMLLRRAMVRCPAPRPQPVGAPLGSTGRCQR